MFILRVHHQGQTEEIIGRLFSCKRCLADRNVLLLWIVMLCNQMHTNLPFVHCTAFVSWWLVRLKWNMLRIIKTCCFVTKRQLCLLNYCWCVLVTGFEYGAAILFLVVTCSLLVMILAWINIIGQLVACSIASQRLVWYCTSAFVSCFITWLYCFGFLFCGGVRQLMSSLYCLTLCYWFNTAQQSSPVN